MSRPRRVVDSRSGSDTPRTFFVTSQTAGRRALFQSETMANLLIDVLRTNVRSGKFTIHDFVVMPNHLHILITVPGNLSIEKAVQFIKGGFSFRAKKELGFTGEIWQKSFTEVGVRDRNSFLNHRHYIELNPVESGFANTAEEYPYSSLFLKRQKRAASKADSVVGSG